ncbi:TonB-dependent receptor [Catenovulum sediminis]|uniref:TonB-dependent receptor n=1 Tax=Catenovulum sediminis TaxID=1740262 RepID=A0ABV1RK08_9ALTE|nr:TonB-dependent receptor [Catenovulum sediminis]
MKQFKPSLLTLALATTGLVSGYSYAAEESADTTEVEEVIRVTGIRGSLMRAQAVKMDSTSVVEAISAEDIGKLPDSSIAESLARLPGLAGERRAGRTSGISVRGFREDYLGTTMNGRELLGMGDNRGVEYDLYPSEIMSGVQVYKTMDASLTTQGIGGVVDMQTVRPLASQEYAAINVNIEQNGMESGNPDFDDQGHRLAASFATKFADDTVGLAVAIASTESPSQEQQFRGWGYDPIDANGDPSLADGVTVPDGGAVVLTGHDSYVRSAVLKRDTLSAVLQFAPTDDLEVTLDALYIDFQEDEVKRGMEEGGAIWGVGSDYTINKIEDGLVTEAVLGNNDNAFKSVIRNDASQKKSELTTFAANIKYNISDNWDAELDFATSEVDKTLTDVESYSGVGRSGHKDQGQGTIRKFVMTPEGAMFSDVDVPTFNSAETILAGPQAWGGGMAGYKDDFGSNTTFAADPNSPINYTNAQDGFVNQPIFHEELDSLRLDLTGALDFGIITTVKAGVRFSDRSKSKDNGGAYLTSKAFPDQGEIPEEYIVGTANLDFIGIGDFVAYDSLSMFESGAYDSVGAASVQADRKGDTYTIDEKVTQLYVKFDVDADLGDVYMRGNFGVQYVGTDLTSHGFFSRIKDEKGLVLADPISKEVDYSHILPSATFNFEFLDNHMIRTSISKTMSRPRIDDLRVSKSVNIDFNPGRWSSTSAAFSPWSASGGNPDLRPYEAKQFDLSYDWYFADDGFFSIAYFYKHLTNWHRNDNIETDFSSVYIPSYHQLGGEAPGTLLGFTDAKTDGLKGYVSGYEAQLSLPLHILTDALDGFGVVLSAAFNDGGLNDGTAVPGLSDESYQVTTYYENSGFEIRLSGRKRDQFLTETRGLSLALEETVDPGSELWDAQIAYNFSESGIDALEGLTVSLQAQNITDEETVKLKNGDPRLVTEYQTFGANYLLGINYKF